jgi:LEA14-like dessication related protein
MRNFVLSAVLASLVASVGCASGGRSSATPDVPPPPFEHPKVSLRDVKFNGVGLTGGSMRIAMMLYNPNPYPLEDPRVTYLVYVDRQELASGVYDPEVTVPAGDSAVVEVPVSFGYRAASGAARALVGTGSVTYRMRGNIYADTPYGRLSAPYDRARDFSAMNAASWSH